MKLTMENPASTLRTMQCEIGLLSQPDGSASLLQGDTSIIAAVYGPTQVRVNKEHIDKATVDVLYKAKSGLPTCADKYSQNLIRKTCETAIIASLHPRTAINIIIQEIQHSGCLLAASLNAAFLAMLDAGVPIQFTVASVQCVLDKDGEVILDPVKKEEDAAKATFMFAFDSMEKNVIGSCTTGLYTQDDYMRCLAQCRQACQHVFDFYRESLEKKIRKALEC